MSNKAQYTIETIAGAVAVLALPAVAVAGVVALTAVTTAHVAHYFSTAQPHRSRRSNPAHHLRLSSAR